MRLKIEGPAAAGTANGAQDKAGELHLHSYHKAADTVNLASHRIAWLMARRNVDPRIS